MRTPQKCLLGEAPSNAKFKVFGCRAFVYKHEHKRNEKLHNCSKEDAYIGTRYGLNHKYMLRQLRLKQTKHANFDGTIFPKRKNVPKFVGVQEGQEEPNAIDDMVGDDPHATNVNTEGNHGLTNQALINEKETFNDEVQAVDDTTLGTTTAERANADTDENSNDTNDYTEVSYRHIQNDALDPNVDQFATQRRYPDRTKKSAVLFSSTRRTHDEDEPTTSEVF